MLAQEQPSYCPRPPPAYGGYALPDSPPLGALGPAGTPRSQSHPYRQHYTACAASAATPFSVRDILSEHAAWEPDYHGHDETVFAEPLHFNEYYSSSLLPPPAYEHHQQQQQQHVGGQGGLGVIPYQFDQQGHDPLSDAMATACALSPASSSSSLALVPGASAVSARGQPGHRRHPPVHCFT